MLTSLRSRLWLSYALVITVALGIVLIVLLAFLIRNPVLVRQVQERLRAVQSLIAASPQRFIDNPHLLEEVALAHDVRILVFDANRELIFDTGSTEPGLPFPRRNWLARNVQVTRDESNEAWMYTSRRLTRDRIAVVAAPRPPRAPALSVFADELLVPILEGGGIALLLSLVLAFALSHWVADPLQQVVLAARGYPKGSGEIAPVSPRGPREVQELTRAFNSMVAHVERSKKSQRDFVANVSHELKTPLTSIQGFAQAILDGTADTPEARRQAAQIIHNEADRMHRLALDLLDLTRLESGTADLQLSRVETSTLLQSITEKFTPQAQKAGIHLQLNIPEQLPAITGDGDRLSQILTNLVDNALKFTPAGGQVVVSAERHGGELQLSITDTGTGIPREALPRIFDRFYQVDRARAGGEKHGAGLGLAIVQEILQAHGGRISVRSEVGHGTAFVIHLPLA